MKKTIIVFIFLISLNACSTAIKYEPINGPTAVQSTALKFTLADSAVTLAPPASSSSKNDGPLEPQDNCAKEKANESNWWACLNHVSAQAAMAPAQSPVDESQDDKRRPAEIASRRIYMAKPADGQHLFFSTTTISGTPIAGQDTIYSKVTISYTNNTNKIITAAGAGAVTGFGIAGPYGAVVGFVSGGVGATPITIESKNILGKQALTLADFICNDDRKKVELNEQKVAKLKTALYFPLTIGAADARPLADPAKVGDPNNKVNADDPTTGCWHLVPNTGSLGIVSPPTPVNVDAAVNSPREPETGDGWLYRLVAVDDPKVAPPDTIPADEYFKDTGLHHDFPYSSCRKVTLQITWWKALATTINGTDAHPAAVTMNTVVADPTYVSKAEVEKGGTINFKPACGANVTIENDTTYGADINAFVSASQGIYKAQQDWEAKKKAKK